VTPSDSAAVMHATADDAMQFTLNRALSDTLVYGFDRRMFHIMDGGH
jgi:hypothetical protein